MVESSCQYHAASFRKTRKRPYDVACCAAAVAAEKNRTKQSPKDRPGVVELGMPSKLRKLALLRIPSLSHLMLQN
jgi:hypothetical protein